MRGPRGGRWAGAAKLARRLRVGWLVAALFAGAAVSLVVGSTAFAQICDNVPPGSYCAYWGTGPGENQTTLTINNQSGDISHYEFVLPSGATVTAVTGGCTFSGNQIRCESGVPNGATVSNVITTQQPLDMSTVQHGTLTTCCDAGGNSTSSQLALQNESPGTTSSSTDTTTTPTMTAPPPPGPPETLLGDMVSLDRELSRLISDWNDDRFTGGPRTTGHRAFVEKIKAIQARKLGIVKAYFDVPTYGAVTTGEVFDDLDCLDADLYYAQGLSLGGLPERAAVEQVLESGKKCKQSLERRLHDAETSSKPPPATLLGDMVSLDRELSTLISDWNDDKFTGGPRTTGHRAFVEKIKAIEALKLGIVKAYFDVPTYGTVGFSEVFNDLGGLDADLYYAQGLSLGGLPERAAVEQVLETGKRLKQALENDLHRAAEQR